MATFSVWKYDTADGAQEADRILKSASGDDLIKIVDTAWVRWDEGAKSPTTHHTDADRWGGAGWGALFGLLFGTLFFLPLIGTVGGAAIGAIYEAVSGVGIKKSDIEKIRQQITPGTSALFVVTKDGDEDRVAERFHGVHSKLLTANLTHDDMHELEATFNQD